jgi:hypothetical protein
MPKHVIKYEYDDGVKLAKPVLWCGRKSSGKPAWRFQDAQHVALAVGGSVQSCKDCIKAIIKQLSEEL